MTALPDPQYQPEFYAGTPTKRLVAWIFDTVIVLVLSLVAVIFTLGLGLFFFALIWLVLSFAYRYVTLARGSATWGMRMAAVEIRDHAGRRLDNMTAFLHTAGYTVSVVIPVLQVISIVLMLVSDRKQGLTDHILGTVALNGRL